ncbi:hypothetical protein BpHYR1_000395 [Brachionus plicatilis]|uniref:Uncharacterized protein n=1 Tax=Brachionus plicatilis TaxID=10195 RepID=A0A3M7Q562_BRAPC|nr:hypothetical protein BpHYR1_000395 [Brachionus plicatilis]
MNFFLDLTSKNPLDTKKNQVELIITTEIIPNCRMALSKFEKSCLLFVIASLSQEFIKKKTLNIYKITRINFNLFFVFYRPSCVLNLIWQYNLINTSTNYEIYVFIKKKGNKSKIFQKGLKSVQPL